MTEPIQPTRMSLSQVLKSILYRQVVQYIYIYVCVCVCDSGVSQIVYRLNFFPYPDSYKAALFLANREPTRFPLFSIKY